MIATNKFTIALTAITFSLLLCGCYTTPFTPIAVPDSHYMKPKVKKDNSAEIAELQELQKISSVTYKIAPSDTFAIVVEGRVELSRPTVMVMPDGTISVSPIGSVKVANLTLPEASELLTQKYAQYIIDSNVVLEPIALKNFTFTIAGTVNAPGIYPFVFGVTRLGDAIAMAGGMLSSDQNLLLSDLESSYISRNGKILPIDFTKAVIENNPLYNIPLANGDYIYIPSLESGKITVLGEVGSQRCVPYQPNLTLLQTIGLAGGVKDTRAKEIKVIRGGLKDPTVYNININDLQMGRAVDFALKPNDIVYLPMSGLSEWNTIIKMILPSFQLLNTMAGPFGNPASTLYDND